MSNTVKAILKLTRWKEFVPFTTILSWLGGLVAYQLYDAKLDWRLLAVMIGNLGAVGYAFMINDIEDAADDARDPNRAGSNPIAAGELDIKSAWIASLITAGVAVLAYALCGGLPFAIGLLTLVLAHLYSWKPVRLKARPLIDILSHALFLSTLLFLAPFYIYAENLGKLWVVALGTFLVSANGQLYNQVRDFEVDRLAGLHNTASILGKTITGYLSTGTIVGSALCLVVTILQGVFPLWLGLVVLVSVPIVLFLGRHNTTDMRGNETTDILGLVQMQFLIVANITLLVWLIAVFLDV